MPRPVEVAARAGWCLWIRYDDGTQGEVDLSHLAGRGVFQVWSDRAFFETVHLGPHGEIVWGEDLDLCPDAVYLRLTGKTPEQIFPKLSEAQVDA